MSRYPLEGRTAVVTGAGSGIGAALASILVRKGCRVALIDRHADRLQETARTINGDAISLHAHDLTDDHAPETLLSAVLAAHGRADILVNNAGVALEGRFEQIAEADYDWVMDVNFRAVVRMTRAFLPTLRRSDDAMLVNVSSIFGIIAPPGQTAYSASNFAVRGFSMALAHELAGTNVHVVVVHPGGVATRIAHDARVSSTLTDAERDARIAAAAKMLTRAPDAAARTIVAGMQARRRRIFVGSDAAVAQRLERLLPTRYFDVVRRLVGEL